MTARLGAGRPAPAIPAATWLAALLAVTSAVELLILRTFTRTAIHIPAIETMQEPYELLAVGGRYAYFVSVVLLALVVPIAGWRLWQRGDVLARLAAGGLAAFTLVAVLAASGLESRSLLDIGTLAAVAVLTGVAAGRQGLRGAVPVGLFGIAFLLSGAHTLAQSASNERLASVDTSGLLLPAEYAGALFALAMPLMLGRQSSRAAVVAGVAVTLVGLAFFLGNGSTSRFLLLWNVGLSGVLPGVVYAVAGGTIAATFAGLLASGRSTTAIAVALLVAGGIGLHSTYQDGLVVTALALLVLGAAPAAALRTVDEPVPGQAVPAPAL
ncbi:MAG: hypothetical protein IT303_11940 [Dehalococcoidia bacterium]|nr:hypothetical protein [Dehalococcoidia bacterium]